MYIMEIEANRISEIDMFQYPAGLYILRLETESGDLVKKIVKR